jgi:GAF domain-containing protein
MPILADLSPANETERLYALRQADILHSLQEDIFDELVALSARLFGLPISYVALLDTDRLHYLATHGFQLPPPVPRQDVLCAQVVRHNRVVLYHDLAAAAHTPLEAPAIANALAQRARFYVGAPLRTAAEHAIGTLCLVDQQPRVFSAQEQSVLEQLAGIIGLLVVLRQQCLHTPALGPLHWQRMRRQVCDEVHALDTLLRYLLQRYGALVPVPDDVLHLFERRLQGVQLLVEEGAA